MRYSGFRILKEALTGHKGWGHAWRDPEPQASYDYIIIGGGGHGLATAYYLAKEFKQARIAVLEKGYLGGGNVGAHAVAANIPQSCWPTLFAAVTSALLMPGRRAPGA